VSNSIDRILDILDVGLQSSQEGGYGSDRRDLCAICQIDEPAEGGDTCEVCRAEDERPNGLQEDWVHALQRAARITSQPLCHYVVWPSGGYEITPRPRRRSNHMIHGVETTHVIYDEITAYDEALHRERNAQMHAWINHYLDRYSTVRRYNTVCAVDPGSSGS
jgi:hypothetical protein